MKKNNRDFGIVVNLKEYLELAKRLDGIKKLRWKCCEEHGALEHTPRSLSFEIPISFIVEYCDGEYCYATSSDLSIYGVDYVNAEEFVDKVKIIGEKTRRRYDIQPPETVGDALWMYKELTGKDMSKKNIDELKIALMELTDILDGKVGGVTMGDIDDLAYKQMLRNRAINSGEKNERP